MNALLRYLGSWMLPMLGLLFVSFPAHAEGGSCPPGYYPIGGQGTMGCAPIPGSGGSQRQHAPQQPPEIWRDRYGAIFTDSDQGALGTSGSQSSRAAAEQAALADCIARGGVACKKVTSYRNACAAFALANSGGYASASRETMEKASEVSMSLCTNSGYGTCRIYYTDCSLPVRVQ